MTLLLLAIGMANSSAGDLPTSTPEEQGIDSVKLGQALKELEQSGWPVDSVLIMRNGKIVLDSYFYPYSQYTA